MTAAPANLDPERTKWAQDLDTALLDCGLTRRDDGGYTISSTDKQGRRMHLWDVDLTFTHREVSVAIVKRRGVERESMTLRNPHPYRRTVAEVIGALYDSGAPLAEPQCSYYAPSAVSTAGGEADGPTGGDGS